MFTPDAAQHDATRQETIEGIRTYYKSELCLHLTLCDNPSRKSPNGLNAKDNNYIYNHTNGWQCYVEFYADLYSILYANGVPFREDLSEGKEWN